jgi:outer membrane protein OmpA-like peptidoglycan-associated protein
MAISAKNIDLIKAALDKTPKWALTAQPKNLAANSKSTATETASRGRQLKTGKIAAILVAVFCVIIAISFQAHANVVGSDIQNFNPTTNGIDFVTVQSSETLEPGIINFGFFLNYAVNTLPNYEPVTSTTRTNFEDTLLGGDINVGVGILKDWDFGASFPQIYARSSDDKNNVYQAEIARTGLTEIRLNTKYRLWGNEQGGFALIGSVNFDRVQDNPFAGTDPGPTFNIEGAWDTTINRYAIGLNAGYRKRDPGTQQTGIPIEPYKDQYIASAAVSYLLSSVDTKLIGEIYGAFPAENQYRANDRSLSSMELLLGIKKDIRHDIALHAGGGTELYHGSSTPDWRVYTGINWNFGPMWPKKPKDKNRKSHFFSEKPMTKENFVVGDVLFDSGSDLVTPEFREILKDLAAYLRKPPGFKQIIIEGHTDSVGREDYNLDLSQRRANSAVNILVKEEGIPASKVKGIGFGESRPIRDNSNYQGRARNRRIEFNISR